ncbi:MAG: 3-phosphoshikimate 1-carboxyvinyltransferase [Candidatus Omnitrophica bacterium]|nr:3-phosphoshikimate 1-carboxyvinyltransferase [Candidatus Omnitrophota bacterium]
MSTIQVTDISGLRGRVSLPGDKSISHRAVMISSIAEGKSSVSNLLDGLDCRATIDAFSNMGIVITQGSDKAYTIEGKGLRGLTEPRSDLYLGNSGTTMRLLLGMLAGSGFRAVLCGDDSLSKRPMKRVTSPLRLMGAKIEGGDDGNLAPLIINPGRLGPIEYDSPVASAQVKSAILLAGLYADGTTKVTEPYRSRDHTERMLRLFGADVTQERLSASVRGLDDSNLTSQRIVVPGDISSAAFFITLGIMADDSEIILTSCGINPTRTGILTVVERMGADVELTNQNNGFEPYADIVIKSSSLKATKVTEDEVPLLIDEIPLIALLGTAAEGTTVIEGCGELRVKETDRVNSIVTNLKAMGADIESEGDSIIIKGPCRLKGASAESFGDHRTAMMMVIAGSVAEGTTTVNDTECIATSFPDFMDTLRCLIP